MLVALGPFGLHLLFCTGFASVQAIWCLLNPRYGLNYRTCHQSRLKLSLLLRLCSNPHMCVLSALFSLLLADYSLKFYDNISIFANLSKILTFAKISVNIKLSKVSKIFKVATVSKVKGK